MLAQFREELGQPGFEPRDVFLQGNSANLANNSKYCRMIKDKI
uniref:Uncharacterized protein n=1 Tax=Anguilla anguilla TaxID=7936 RepID=A0A0E9PQ34_ANGAN